MIFPHISTLDPTRTMLAVRSVEAGSAVTLVAGEAVVAPCPVVARVRFAFVNVHLAVRTCRIHAPTRTGAAAKKVEVSIGIALLRSI